MKTEDLRIGNIVKSLDGNTVLITPKKLLELFQIDISENEKDLSKYIKCYEITDVLLDSIGLFNKRYNEHVLISDKLRIALRKSTKNKCYLCDLSDTKGRSVITIEINGFHELQNLVYSILKIEL